MAQWVIRSQQEFEREWIAKLGREEFNRRSSVAKAKSDELDDGTSTGFNESCVLSGIFLSIALELSQESFDKLVELSINTWRRLAYKMAI